MRTGNIRTGELKELFRRHLSDIETALDQNSLVELDRLAVKVVAWMRRSGST